MHALPIRHGSCVSPTRDDLAIAHRLALQIIGRAKHQPTEETGGHQHQAERE